jgi:hypothetical protein
LRILSRARLPGRGQTPTRASWAVLWASPETAVHALQAANESARIARREARSARRAIGMPQLAYSTAKAGPVRKPSSVSERPSSSLIGWISIAST